MSQKDVLKVLQLLGGKATIGQIIDYEKKNRINKSLTDPVKVRDRLIGLLRQGCVNQSEDGIWEYVKEL